MEHRRGKTRRGLVNARQDPVNPAVDQLPNSIDGLVPVQRVMERQEISVYFPWLQVRNCLLAICVLDVVRWSLGLL